MKVLLIPLAILAFVLFLLVLGAIGLAIAFGIIAAVGKLWRLLTGVRPRRRSSKGLVPPS